MAHTHTSYSAYQPGERSFSWCKHEPFNPRVLLSASLVFWEVFIVGSFSPPFSSSSFSWWFFPLHRILARITTNTQTRQRSKVPPPQVPFFGARERNRNGAHSRRAKKTKTHTSSWHDDDGVVSCSFLKSCGLFHHFLLLCVCVCCRPISFFILTFLSLWTV